MDLTGDMVTASPLLMSWSEGILLLAAGCTAQLAIGVSVLVHFDHTELTLILLISLMKKFLLDFLKDRYASFSHLA